MNRVIFVFFLLLFPMNMICVSSESFYIVTNHSSYCPSEISGEPCLTLNQYVVHGSRSLNVTLTFESGNHFLTYKYGSYKLYNYGSGYGYRSSAFVMTAQSAKIIYSFPQARLSVNSVHSVEISGITFTGSGGIISVYRAQEVQVYDCHFQKVRLYLRNVGNATFVRCTFSNYIYNNQHYSSPAALSFYSSTAVVIQCNFTNNEGAILFQYYRASGKQLLLSIIESTFANNTSNYPEGGAVVIRNYGQSYYYYGNYYYTDTDMQHLNIRQSRFVNNTSQYGGGALYLNANHVQVVVEQCIFIDNTADRKGGRYRSRESGGGAVYLRGRNSSYTLTGNKFINNSANQCGALNVIAYLDRNITTIMNNTFYHNKADSAVDVGGGAMCISNTSAVVTNSTFVGNSAKVDGGAILSNNSTVTIIDSYFSNNTALRDGGALAVNVCPSDFTITDTCFMENQAGDDGGAIFVGRKGSHVRVDRGSLINNHATDRSGAIAIFGNNIEVTDTDVAGNSARIGETGSSCNSNVITSIPFQRDYNCLFYGAVNATVGGEQERKCLTVTVSDYCIEYLPTLAGELRSTVAVAYTSLSVSITIVLAVLIYITVTRLLKCNREGQTANEDCPEPLYAQATNDEAFDMKANELYGKCWGIIFNHNTTQAIYS